MDLRKGKPSFIPLQITLGDREEVQQLCCISNFCLRYADELENWFSAHYLSEDFPLDANSLRKMLRDIERETQRCLE